METSSVKLVWNEGMHFVGDIDGHSILLDAGMEFGGQNKGTSPKKLVLMALAGCTSIDVVSILNKMRVAFDQFEVSVEAPSTDEHPKVYTSFTLVYSFAGTAPENREKLERAINLSLDKYCSVAAMLSKAAPIEYRLVTDQE